jgi:hypothetical protein
MMNEKIIQTLFRKWLRSVSYNFSKKLAVSVKSIMSRKKFYNTKRSSEKGRWTLISICVEVEARVHPCHLPLLSRMGSVPKDKKREKGRGEQKKYL